MITREQEYKIKDAIEKQKIMSQFIPVAQYEMKAQKRDFGVFLVGGPIGAFLIPMKRKEQ